MARLSDAVALRTYVRGRAELLEQPALWKQYCQLEKSLLQAIQETIGKSLTDPSCGGEDFVLIGKADMEFRSLCKIFWTRFVP